MTQYRSVSFSSYFVRPLNPAILGDFSQSSSQNLKAGGLNRTVLESDVWQRRFWEHTIRDEADWQQHLDYIHYNPVKHGLVSCPHLWAYSSFTRWVERGSYSADWGCVCGGKVIQVSDFKDIADRVGE